MGNRRTVGDDTIAEIADTDDHSRGCDERQLRTNTRIVRWLARER